jgi:hypothetical protein
MYRGWVTAHYRAYFKFKGWVISRLPRARIATDGAVFRGSHVCNEEKQMKLSQIGAVMIAAMGLAATAHAEQRGAGTATVKAIFDYCARVDEHDRGEYLDTGSNMLLHGNSAGDSGDYQSTYDAVTEALNKTPESVGQTKCAATVVAPAVHHREHGDDR